MPPVLSVLSVLFVVYVLFVVSAMASQRAAVINRLRSRPHHRRQFAARPDDSDFPARLRSAGITALGVGGRLIRPVGLTPTGRDGGFAPRRPAEKGASPPPAYRKGVI